MRTSHCKQRIKPWPKHDHDTIGTSTKKNSSIGYFARTLMQELRLVSGYDVLYGKVKAFVQDGNLKCYFRFRLQSKHSSCKVSLVTVGCTPVIVSLQCSQTRGSIRRVMGFQLTLIERRYFRHFTSRNT